MDSTTTTVVQESNSIGLVMREEKEAAEVISGDEEEGQIKSFSITIATLSSSSLLSSSLPNKEEESGKDNPTRRTFNVLRQRRNVSFHNTVELRYTLCLDDFTEQELLNTWWTLEEIDLLQQSCAEQIQQIDSKNNALLSLQKQQQQQQDQNQYDKEDEIGSISTTEEDEGDSTTTTTTTTTITTTTTTRGLEIYTQLGALASYKSRIQSIDAVLDKQEYLTAMHVDRCDQDICIAHVYRLVTSSCQLWANIVGLEDAREAAKVYESLLESLSPPTAGGGDSSFSLSPRSTNNNNNGDDHDAVNDHDHTTNGEASSTTTTAAAIHKYHYYSRETKWKASKEEKDCLLVRLGMMESSNSAATASLVETYNHRGGGSTADGRQTSATNSATPYPCSHQIEQKSVMARTA